MPLADTAKLAVQLDLKGNFSQGVAKAQRSLGKLGSSSAAKSSILTGVGLGAGATGFGLVATGIGKAIDAMGDAVNNASDLAEAQSKVNVVFEDGAAEVTEWARAADEAMGLSDAAALEAAGTFGNFLQAMEVAQAQSQDMSLAMVQLAADIGSFNNVASDEVLLALRAGLAGESEPLRRFGVAISAAEVESRILAKGIANTKDEITEAMKVTERYSIIMEDTTLAQGDFARTSGGLANSQRDLSATLTDVSAKFGALIEGPLTDFLNIVDDALSEQKMSDVDERFTTWAEGLRGVGDEAVEATAKLQEAGSGLGLFEDLFTETPLGLLAPGFTDAANKWGDNRAELERLGLSFDTFQNQLRSMVNNLGITSDEALRLTLEWGRQETALGDLAQGMYGAGVATDRAAEAQERAAEAAAKAAAEAEALAAAEAKAAAQAARLQSAMEGIVGVSVSSLKDDFKGLTQTIRQAAQDESWALLGKQLNDLQRMRSRYMKEREFDAVALIDVAIAENLAQQKQRRQISKHYREEAGESADTAGSVQRDLQGTQDELGLTRQEAAGLRQEFGRGWRILLDDSDLDGAIGKLNVIRGLLASAAAAPPLSVPRGPTGPSVPPSPPPPPDIRHPVNISAHAVANSQNTVHFTRRAGVNR